MDFLEPLKRIFTKCSACGAKRRQLPDFSRLSRDQNLDEFEVGAFLHLCKSTLRNKLNPKCAYYDPSFPRPHSMRGEALKGHGVRWKAGRIIDWNDQQDTLANLGKDTKSAAVEKDAEQ